VELTGRLSALLGAPVTDLARMVGGASRETWSFRCGGASLVARVDPPGAVRHGVMAREAALLRAAGAAGMPVPSVLAAQDDLMVMERLSGQTLGRRILRAPALAAARSRLTAQCAAALAVLHTRVAPVAGLPVADDPLALIRTTLDELGEPHPALELGLLRLARTRPEPVGRAVVHGDFRLGNLMVDESGLVGALDWELAHLGDPAEDLGWLCVRSWRFGGPAPVAGVGTRAELLEAYADAGGAVVDEATLRWWEAYGTLRWGVICVQQAAAHLTGAVRSVELAAIGRRTCEVELDLLDLVAPLPLDVPVPEPADGPHDRPTAAELLAAAREWLATLELTGHEAYLARVTSNVLGVVAREQELGPVLSRRHAERLAAQGMSSTAELAAAVRAGRDDDATVAAIHALVVDKVAVADPRQLER
jgi:aminoglycoside phosphotransferase (APT) family kinase protein